MLDVEYQSAALSELEEHPPADIYESLLLRRRSTNTTSQLAIIGSNLCPIESLDYELLENDVFNQDWESRGKSGNLQYVFLKWTLSLLIGIVVGAIGFFNNLAVESIAGLKFVSLSNLMIQNRYWAAFGFFVVSNFVLLLFAVAITASVSTAAGGSGIPEVKAYLNGVDAPNILSLRTLFVKIVGLIAAVSSSLYVDKAGPLVHIGGCIGALLGQGGSLKYHMTCKWLRYFKNDRDRRDLVTIGSAAGIAAAFRSPVGGVLFALESLSSWWRSALIWRALFTTAVVAVLLLSLINFCESGKCGPFGKGGLIMYNVTEDAPSYRLEDLPAVVFLGIVGGLLGSLYNFLMLKVLRLCNIINERGIPSKLLLAAIISIVTSCCIFGLPWLASCRPCTHGNCPSVDFPGSFKNFQCPTNYYNDLAGLFINTNDDTIRKLFSTGTSESFQKSSVFVFFIASYFLGIVSYSVAAPFGLFVPIILIGGSYGRLVGMLMGSHSLDHGLFAILGSASFLGGTMRMTVSLCVIILELTNNLLLLPLVMLVLLISKSVADSFNQNIYDLILKLKGLPYLDDHAEPYMRQLTVSDVITGPLQTFNSIENVGNIVHILRTTGHHAFPVTEEPPNSKSPMLYGLVLRAHLLTLLKKKCFLPDSTITDLDALKEFMVDDFAKRGSGKHDRIEDISLTEEELNMYINLHPFANTSPYTVVETMSLAKALALFREVGLRHLLVIPKSSSRAPVVGILTRHDFMPEHILGLHPYLVKSRWKRLRIHKSTLTLLARNWLSQLCQ